VREGRAFGVVEAVVVAVVAELEEFELRREEFAVEEGRARFGRVDDDDVGAGGAKLSA
jgi:hypothetical protein